MSLFKGSLLKKEIRVKENEKYGVNKPVNSENRTEVILLKKLK